jgi:heterodisulfide reductase subunit B
MIGEKDGDTQVRVAYFPGCSLHSMARDYDVSAKLVCKHLGISLEEIEDWNCCGASSAHSLDRVLATGLALRNLVLVKKMNLKQLTAPCAACYSRLKIASFEMMEDENLRDEVAQLIESPLPHGIRITSLLEMLTDKEWMDSIARHCRQPLKGLKLAAYYGCLLVRPARVTGFDNPEQPMSMDRLIETIGAEAVKWSHKAECCGAGFAAFETNTAVELSGEILEAARQTGAEAIVTACPLCHTTLDSRQEEIARRSGIQYNLPVLYFTQLVSLAFGYSPKDAGLQRLMVNPVPLLETKGLA